jgi:hypothetical protein
MLENKEAVDAKTTQLFSEEPFRKFRFTAAEVQAACEKVGYVAGARPNPERIQTLLGAMLNLCTRQRRAELCAGLFMEFPEYVANGRYEEAWIIQKAALLTSVSEEANPFLFEMFSYGYDEWMRRRREATEAVLIEAGLDVAAIKKMSPQEVYDQINALDTNPGLKARLEEVIAKTPDGQAQAMANLLDVERDALDLLEREDARPLLLSAGEVESKMPDFFHRIEAIMKLAAPTSADSGGMLGPTDPVCQEVQNLIRAMREAVFSPERIQQLLGQLRHYGHERSATGDNETARKALASILLLEMDQEPTQNTFLNLLCYVSLRFLSPEEPVAQ